MKPRERIVAFISGFHSLNGFPPTIREISRGVGKSPSVVCVHLKKLEQEGRISRRGTSPRTLRVVE